MLGASARCSHFHTPVETSTPPRRRSKLHIPRFRALPGSSLISLLLLFPEKRATAFREEKNEGHKDRLKRWLSFAPLRLLFPESRRDRLSGRRDEGYEGQGRQGLGHRDGSTPGSRKKLLCVRTFSARGSPPQRSPPSPTSSAGRPWACRPSRWGRRRWRRPPPCPGSPCRRRRTGRPDGGPAPP